LADGGDARYYQIVKDDLIARRLGSTRALFLAEAAIVAVAVPTTVFSIWLADHVTVRGIIRPSGAYTIPYGTHGGTVFISQTEQTEMILQWIVWAALVAIQLWPNRAKLLRRT
jgi:hypothetical protein